MEDISQPLDGVCLLPQHIIRSNDDTPARARADPFDVETISELSISPPPPAAWATASVGITQAVHNKIYSSPPWSLPRRAKHHSPHLVSEQLQDANIHYLRLVMQFSHLRYPDADPAEWSKGRVLEVGLREGGPPQVPLRPPSRHPPVETPPSHINVFPASLDGVLIPLRRGHTQCSTLGCPWHADYFNVLTVGEDYCYNCAQAMRFKYMDFHMCIPYQDEEEPFVEWPQSVGLPTKETHNGIIVKQLHFEDVVRIRRYGNTPSRTRVVDMENSLLVPFLRHVKPRRHLHKRLACTCLKCRNAKATWGISSVTSYREAPIARYCRPCALATAEVINRRAEGLEGAVRARRAGKLAVITLKKVVPEIFANAGRRQLYRGHCWIREGDRCKATAIGRHSVHRVIDHTNTSVIPTGSVICDDEACIVEALQLLPESLGISTGRGSVGQAR